MNPQPEYGWMSDVKHTAGPTTKTSLHCNGCPALHTDDWSFVEENDGLDSGTDAKCTAMTPVKHIASYWSASTPVPAWCPALASGETP